MIKYGNMPLGRSFSLLYHGKTGTLAPDDDLLSTEIYPKLSHESALAIGKDCEFSQITRKSFEQMALDCQIRPGAVLDQIDKLVSVTLKHAPSLANDLNAKYPSPVYAEILHVIERQSTHLVANA